MLLAVDRRYALFNFFLVFSHSQNFQFAYFLWGSFFELSYSQICPLLIPYACPVFLNYALMLSRIFIVHLEQIKGTSKVLLEPIIVPIQTAFYMDFVLILLLVTLKRCFYITFAHQV